MLFLYTDKEQGRYTALELLLEIPDLLPIQIKSLSRDTVNDRITIDYC